MTINILTILLIATLALSACCLILGICSWIEPRNKEKKDKELSAKEGNILSYMESFYNKAKQYLEELDCDRRLTLARILIPDRYTEFLENDIIQALEQGVEYKRKYEAFSKGKEIELRKFCIEQHPDKRSYLSERIEYAEILYQYLTTGKQPQKK